MLLLYYSISYHIIVSRPARFDVEEGRRRSSKSVPKDDPGGVPIYIYIYIYIYIKGDPA